ncbi:MAG: HAD family hydrolase [Planctomycetaceae bacterium]|nr:HAD family hydrolase [Planctomycetaceae bacterium]
MRLNSILFDLGETLLDFGKVDLPGLFRQGAAAAYEYLRELGQPLPHFGRFHRLMLGQLRWRLVANRLLHRDFDARVLLKRLGGHLGQTLTAAQLDQLAWRWYQPLSACATVEPGTREMLEGFRNCGLNLAVVSNTFVPGPTLDRHLASENLLDLLPLRVYSCDVSYRKPDSRIFRKALAALNIQPQQAMFVGDSLIADVWGANRLGMISILKSPAGRTSRWIRPRHRIRSLLELPALVARYL